MHSAFKKLSDKSLKKISKLKSSFNKKLKLHKKSSKDSETALSAKSDAKMSLTSDISEDSQLESQTTVALSRTLTVDEESKLSEIALKNLRKEQVNEILDKAKDIMEEKDRFSEYFTQFLTTLENFKSERLQLEKRMKRFIDCLELSVEELKRKEQDFQQINDLVHMVRAIIEKENSHIRNFIMHNFRNLYKGEFEDLCQFLSSSYIECMMKSDLTQFKDRMKNLSVPRGIISTYKLIHHYYEQAGRKLFLRDD
jgi:FtsZ-binding cell division protein ZapB